MTVSSPVGMAAPFALFALLALFLVPSSTAQSIYNLHNGANLTLLHSLSTTDVTFDLTLPQHSKGPDDGTDATDGTDGTDYTDGTDGSFPYLIFATEQDHTLWMTDGHDGHDVTNVGTWDPISDTKYGPKYVHWFGQGSGGVAYIAVGPSLYAHRAKHGGDGEGGGEVGDVGDGESGEGGEGGAIRVMEGTDAGGFWISNFLTFRNAVYFARNSTLFRLTHLEDGGQEGQGGQGWQGEQGGHTITHTTPIAHIETVETFPNAIQSVGAGNGYILVALHDEYVLDDNDEWQPERTNVYAVHVTDASGTSTTQTTRTTTTTLLTSNAFGANILPHERNPVTNDGHVLFSADEGLWRTLGTAESTVQYFHHGGGASKSGRMKFGMNFKFDDGRVHTGVTGEHSFSFLTGGTEESTTPLIPCNTSNTNIPGIPGEEEDGEHGEDMEDMEDLPQGTTCKDVETHTGITGFGDAGAYRGRVATGPPMDGRLLIFSVGAGSGGSGGTNDMDVFLTNGVETDYVTSIPDFVPYQGNRMSDDRLILSGFRMGSDPPTYQVWILDGTDGSDGTEEGGEGEEGSMPSVSSVSSMLLVEFINQSFDNDCGVLESMNGEFVLVNTCEMIYRLDVPPKRESGESLTGLTDGADGVDEADGAAGEDDEEDAGNTENMEVEETAGPVESAVEDTVDGSTISPSVASPADDVVIDTREQEDPDMQSEPDIATSDGSLALELSRMFRFGLLCLVGLFIFFHA